MVTPWRCPECKRSFTRENQRHACGVGDRADVLRNRPESLVRLYATVEAYAKSLGAIELVTRERYVLFRTLRIFADLVVMSDALRLAIHLGRKVEHPIFFKIASDRGKVTHVAKLVTAEDFAAVKPLLEEAYEYSLATPKR
jgi:predicted transport protein